MQKPGQVCALRGEMTCDAIPSRVEVRRGTRLMQWSLVREDPALRPEILKQRLMCVGQAKKRALQTTSVEPVACAGHEMLSAGQSTHIMPNALKHVEPLNAAHRMGSLL